MHGLGTYMVVSKLDFLMVGKRELADAIYMLGSKQCNIIGNKAFSTHLSLP
jgi:hypothetical protein